jgi:hypothetical protein
MAKPKFVPDENYPIKPMSELHNEPPINWLIEPWFARRELACFWGDPGTYKSFLCQNLSLQLAASGRRVLYVAAEGASGLASRVAAWNALKHGDPDRHDEDWFYMPRRVEIDQKEDRASFITHVEAVCGSVDLIVLDTLARNFLGDENSAKEMGRFIDGMEVVQDRLGAAVWAVHHANLSDDNKRERGSSALRAAMFGMYHLDDPKSLKGGGVSVRLTCDKLKEGKEPTPVRIDFDNIAHDFHIYEDLGEVMKTSMVMKGRFPENARPDLQKESSRDAINQLAISIATEAGSVSWEDLSEATGLNKSQANKRLYQLSQQKELVRVSNHNETSRYEVP